MISLKRPGAAIGLVITMFGVEQFFQTRNAIFIDRSQLVNLGVGLVAAIAAVTWLSGNIHRFKFDRVQIACLFLILMSQLSQFWTIDPRAFAQYYSRTPLPYYVLYLLIAPVLSQGKDSIRNGIWSTVYIGMTLVILIVFFVEWTGRGILMAKPVLLGGYLKLYANPLALASLASYIAIMCVVLKPKKALWKAVHVLIFAMACYVVYRTQSRGQLVALGIVTMIFYPLANQASKSKELIFTFVGFAIFSFALYSVFSIFDLGEMNRWRESNIRSATEGRIFMVTALLSEWYNSGPFNWFFGLGSAAGWKTSGFCVHNFPAEVLGELGLIGFSIYCYINIQTLVNSFTILRKLKHYPDMKREALVLIALFAFSFLLSFKSISLFSTAPLMFYFAIAISQLEKHSRQFSSAPLSLRQLILVSKLAHDTTWTAPRNSLESR